VRVRVPPSAPQCFQSLTALPSSGIVLHAWANRCNLLQSIFNGLQPDTANTCNADATFSASQVHSDHLLREQGGREFESPRSDQQVRLFST
jgi:hypothetical protein